MNKLFVMILMSLVIVSIPVLAAPEAPSVKPAAALKDLEWVKGEAVTFKPGQVYIVEFWATWCPPCKASIPHLTEMQQKYKDKKVTIIGISNEPLEKIKPFVDQMGDKMNYTVAADPKQTATKNYMQAYKVRGIPAAFIVDGKGNVVWNGHPMAGMDGVLDEVLAGTFDAAAYAKKKAEEERKQAAQQALMKKLSGMYQEYLGKIEKDGPSAESRQLAKDIIKEAPADVLNQIAWDILTRVKKEHRELPVALAAAAKANKLSENKNPAVLDTYAKALFESGRTAQAIKAQQKAVSLVKDNAEAEKEMTETLNKYKAAAAEKAKPAAG